jgi:hypothetical protein
MRFPVKRQHEFSCNEKGFKRFPVKRQNEYVDVSALTTVWHIFTSYAIKSFFNTKLYFTETQVTLPEVQKCKYSLVDKFHCYTKVSKYRTRRTAHQRRTVKEMFFIFIAWGLQDGVSYGQVTTSRWQPLTPSDWRLNNPCDNLPWCPPSWSKTHSTPISFCILFVPCIVIDHKTLNQQRTIIIII